MSNDLEVIQQTMTDLAMSRPPEAVLAEAQKAAAALKEVISKKSKPVIMNGEQYLEYEDWQTVGHFYGLKVRTGDAVPVEINGVHGAKAQAWVVDLHTGKEIGGAEAYCLRDERNWETKPWFQLASMAQTRAGSKSLRNVLAWVVVLAGYKPTPAEEMAGIFPERKPIPQVRPRNDATMMRPATDRSTGEPTRQEDGAGLPSQEHMTQQASDAPVVQKPQSAAEFAKQKADETPDLYVDGYLGNIQPYSGKTAFQKGCKPGLFDIEDISGRTLLMGVKYFDPTVQLSSGAKRVHYRIEYYKGKEQYNLVSLKEI